MATLINNWHHDKYKIRGGKRHIKESGLREGELALMAAVSCGFALVVHFLFPFCVVEDWANLEASRARGLLQHLNKLSKISTESRLGSCFVSVSVLDNPRS